MRVSVVAPVLPFGEDGVSVPHSQPEPDLLRVESGKSGLKAIFRNWLLYPDNDVNWCKQAGLAARRAWPDSVDWVITTSPPESVHLVGPYLQKYLGCHWHADIRDFWLEYPLLDIRRNKLRKFIEKSIAKKLLSKADLVTAVSDGMAQEAKKLSGRHVNILGNFASASPARNYALFADYPKDTIHILYTGAFEISDPRRKLEPVLDVFNEACNRNSNLFLHIMGPLSLQETIQLRETPVAHRCKYYGKVSLEAAREYQASADALLITAAPGTVVVPGKLVEYQSTGLPIIAVGSGPWMGDMNYEADPVHALATLQPVFDLPSPLPVITADMAAKTLLTLMGSSES